MLQWGRGLLAAEIRSRDVQLQTLCMTLQWGRGLLAAEMPTVNRSGLGRIATELQWGRGLLAAEIGSADVTDC